MIPAHKSALSISDKTVFPSWESAGTTPALCTLPPAAGPGESILSDHISFTTQLSARPVLGEQTLNETEKRSPRAASVLVRRLNKTARR